MHFYQKTTVNTSSLLHTCKSHSRYDGSMVNIFIMAQFLQELKMHSW